MPKSGRPVLRVVREVTGRVVSKNLLSQFVVVDFPLGALPEIGDQLAVRRDGATIAQLRVTGPIRGFLVIADIAEGDPRPGDRVEQIR